MTTNARLSRMFNSTVAVVALFYVGLLSPVASAQNAPATAGASNAGFAFPARVPAYEAAPRRDENSQKAHLQLLEKKTAGRIDVYFEGDSITRRWGATDYPEFLAHWKSNFFGWNAADFGWGADSTQNILWRLQNGELDGVNPKVIVLLAGTNNVGALKFGDDPDDAVAEITRGIQAIVHLMQEKAPNATIILTGITPRNDNMAYIPVIEKINRNLSRLADGRKIRWVYLNDKWADKDGKLFEGITVDRLHPTLKGYNIWAEALKPLFNELLGPQAREDHAPPPTGDPSAKK